MRLERRVVSALAVAAVLAYSIIAALAFAENSKPGPPETPARWNAPASRHLIRIARRELGDAFAELESSSGLPAAEIDAFATRLRYAQSLYRSASLGDVLGGEAVLGLAATACELDQIAREGGTDHCQQLLTIAEQREPRNGSYQLRVADAWFRTGRASDGARIAAEAVRLNHMNTPRALQLLATYGVSPAESVAILGGGAEALAAAREHFARSGDPEEFLALAEARLGDCASTLFESYGEMALRLRQLDRVVRQIDGMPSCAAPDVEAIRLRTLGQGLLALGRNPEAAAAAAAAAALRPRDPRISELLGDCQVASARPDAGSLSYRKALGEVARTSGSTGQMARLYRKLGECFETMGEGGRAFDAYTKSLEYNPDDPVGQARLHSLTRRPVASGARK